MSLKALTRVAMLALVALVVLVPAQAALSIRITEDGVVQAPFCISLGPSSLTCATSTAAFTLDIQTGTSNSPGPATLTLTGSVTAASGGHTLLVEVSDTDFSIPTGGATLVQTVTTNTPALGAAPGTLVGTGGFSNGNGLFCIATATCTAVTPNASFTSFLATNPGQTTQVGGTFTAPFSMDEQLLYTFTGAGTALITATLSAVVPEPASVALLGGVLLFVVGAIRRKATRV